MANGFWRLNHRNLTATNVTVIATEGARAESIRSSVQPIHRGREVVDRLGAGLPRVQLEFTILRSTTTAAYYSEAAYIEGTIVENESFRLEAPTTGSPTIVGTSKVAQLIATDVELAHQQGQGKIVVSVTAIVLGVPLTSGPREGGTWVDAGNRETFFYDNEFWVATNSAGYVGAARLRAHPQVDGYPRGLRQSNKILEPLAAYKSLTAGGAGTTTPMPWYAAANFVWTLPLDEGEGGPLHIHVADQYEIDAESVNKNAGFCRLYTATTSGFDGTLTDPSWTILAGTREVGQSPTALTVFDNGLVRLVLDRQVSSTAAMRIYAFDGSAWRLVLQNGTDWLNPRVVRIEANRLDLLQALVMFKDSGGKFSLFRLRVRLGLPTVEFQVVALDPSPASRLRFSGAISTFETRQAWTKDQGVRDAFRAGNAARTMALTTDNTMILWERQGRYELVFSSTEQSAFEVFETSAGDFDPAIVPAQQVNGSRFWISHLLRTYTDKGTSGSTPVRREAEDGETAVVGTWADDVNDATSKTNGTSIKNTTAADADTIRWTVNVPTIGKWWVEVRARTGAGSQTMVVTLDGTPLTSPAIPTTAWAADPVSTRTGPFTIASAGDKTLDISPSGAYEIDLDHIVLVPDEETATTPTTALFPKNIAHDLLLPVGIPAPPPDVIA